MEMEQHHGGQWDDEDEIEVEEVALQLQGRQSRHVNNNNKNNATTAVVISISSNGSSNDNDNSFSSTTPTPTPTPTPPPSIIHSTNSELMETQELNNDNEDAAVDGDGEAFILHNHNHQGTESTHGISGMKYRSVECFNVETNFGDDELDAKAIQFDIQGLSTEINHQFGKNVEDETFSALNLSPTHNSCDAVDADVDLIEEFDQKITEFDVERVLQKQDTHDLYCPNCNSCITRGVILRRRKPKIQNLRYKARRDKVETNVRSQFDSNPKHAADDQGCDTANICPTLAADEDNHDREPDIFRCLSCFSFFIPTGNGFKVFWSFGDSNEKENMQNPEKISGAKKNWFFSTFASDQRKTTSEQDSAEGAQIKPQQSGEESPSPSTVQSLLLEKSLIEADHKSSMEVGNETLADQNGLSSSIQGASSPAESFCGVGLVNNAAAESQEAGNDILNTSKQEHILIENVLSNVAGKSDDAMVKNNTGEDVVVIVEREPTSSQRVQNIVVSAEAGILSQSVTQHIDEDRRAEVSEAYGLDILKSVVYGGLIESVTSLGVVSSAAGAGASTLNILALGLANLIGGLFIIGHNLKELKNDHSRGASSQLNEQEDRYQELLGRREKFLLHATVAVLSFIVFGLVPPVVYGFSFPKSDDRELKLAAVLGASLVCIILLAVGKCHIRKPPKAYVKTVLYYVIIVLMGSGVSYIVGILIKKLLDKLGWFEYSLATTVPFLESHSMDRAWASY